ncbi:MAG TPA: M23 family metallopeptidase [Geobacteraceae bacterium]
MIRCKSMARMLLFLTLLLVSDLPCNAGTSREAVLQQAASGASCEPCTGFNLLNTLVRDGRILRPKAKEELLRLLPAIREYYYANGGKDYDRSEWVFPLEGYSARAIAEGRRHGYEPRGYDFCDGNRHKAHPALDIFIRDRDRDQRDDRTGAFVPVLSLTGGVVVALENSWEPGSALRGGKYLWIYDPAADILVYYAHNRELSVGLGAVVRPGDRIAFVGRTGLNAYRKRSPTHLHISCLKVGDGALTPENLYPVLLHSRTRSAREDGTGNPRVH